MGTDRRRGQQPFGRRGRGLKINLDSCIGMIYWLHYSKVTWASWRFKSPTIRQFIQQLAQTSNTGNLKARHSSFPNKRPVMWSAFPWDKSHVGISKREFTVRLFPCRLKAESSMTEPGYSSVVHPHCQGLSKWVSLEGSELLTIYSACLLKHTHKCNFVCKDWL